jgi:CRISPR-associated protein Cas2
MRLFCLVCFDIVDDRARTRAAKTLKEYGVRVQKSVFECGLLTEKKFLNLKTRLEDLIDSSEDTVRYYFVCRGCLDKMEYSGIGVAPDTKDYRVV